MPVYYFSRGWQNSQRHYQFINMSEFLDTLKKDHPFARKCRFCESDPANPTWEQIDKLLNCPNCIGDIFCLGNWSGDGIGYLAALWKKDPDNPKWAVLDKLLAQVHA